jgi:hypothetical protein
MRETCEECGLARARSWLFGQPPTKVRVCSICMLRALETMHEGGTMKATVGRIVHYTNLGDREGVYKPETQAALITGLNEDGSVALCVFYRTGRFDMPKVSETSAPAGSEEARGKWCWPARES